MERVVASNYYRYQQQHYNLQWFDVKIQLAKKIVTTRAFPCMKLPDNSIVLIQPKKPYCICNYLMSRLFIFVLMRCLRKGNKTIAVVVEKHLFTTETNLATNFKNYLCTVNT